MDEKREGAIELAPCEWVVWSWKDHRDEYPGWSRIEHDGIVWRRYGPLDAWAREGLLRHYFGNDDVNVGSTYTLALLQYTPPHVLAANSNRRQFRAVG